MSSDLESSTESKWDSEDKTNYYQICTLLVSNKSEIPSVWAAFCYLPQPFTFGQAYPWDLDFFGKIGATERIVSLRIVQGYSIPTLDLTSIFVQLLGIPSLKKMLWESNCDSWAATYQAKSFFKALKDNTNLTSLFMYGPKGFDGAEFLGPLRVRRLIRDAVDNGNTALEELDLIEKGVEKRTIVFRNKTDIMLKPFGGHDIDCWAGILRALNLNALGRKKLTEVTLGVAEFVDLLDHKKIMTLVNPSHFNMQKAIDHDDCDEDEEVVHLMVGEASLSLEALTHNFRVLLDNVQSWIIIKYLDLRETDLLYGMLRESPGIWCGDTFDTPVKPSKRQRLSYWWLGALFSSYKGIGTFKQETK